VVNNAGYGQFGMVEELSEAESREQIETNLFGALWVTQAALPFLRAQGSGHFLQVSSIGGVSAFPTVGIYHASKWALEGLSQALAQEIVGFGIKVTLIEPGGYSTDWGGSSAKHATALPAYDEVREQAANRPSRRGTPGDPVATRDAVLTLVDSDNPPLRVFFGEAPLAIATADYESRLATWNVSRSSKMRICSDPLTMRWPPFLCHQPTGTTTRITSPGSGTGTALNGLSTSHRSRWAHTTRGLRCRGSVSQAGPDRCPW
jgi:hypothetical protein